MGCSDVIEMSVRPRRHVMWWCLMLRVVRVEDWVQAV